MLNTVALSANAMVTARLQYKEEHSIIVLHVNDSQRCSEVELWGEHDDGMLAYRTFTGCDLFGWNCRTYSVSAALQGDSAMCALATA